MGELRVGGYGFSIERGVGWGWVTHPDADAPASLPWLRAGEFTVGTHRHGRVRATFHAKPPFDPQGKRIQGDYSEAVEPLAEPQEAAA